MQTCVKRESERDRERKRREEREVKVKRKVVAEREQDGTEKAGEDEGKAMQERKCS